MAILRFREQSQFTYKDLLDLNDPKKAYNSPLAVICHIDLNAFFAQCEQIRLGLSLDDPVVCVQWNALIAVSYAARQYGITRMDRLEQAKLKCPNLIPAHTAVFKKGQPFWKYVDYMPSPIDHKVSLDPYRREGKKVLNIFRSECDLVEKASVDESFMDLGRLVFKKIMELFPDLLEGMVDRSSKLKLIDKLPDGLNYKGYVIAKKDEAEIGSSIADDNHDYLIEDWDDLVSLIGSMICFDLRKKVETELGYKTSGGIGRVKTIAKLASGFQKPDQQTIVRNDSIPIFLKYFKLTDFWSLGGKTGDYIKEKLGDDITISLLRTNFDSPLKIAKLLDNDTELANKLYKMVRGELYTEIENKELIKSMMANKNFRGKSVSSTKDLLPWLDVFIGELMLRIQDLDEEYNTVLRPTKMTLTARSASGARHSKQCTMNQPPKDYEKLKSLFYTLSNDLLKGLEEMWLIQSPHRTMYPIINAGMGVSIFNEMNTTNTLDDLILNVKKKRKIDSSRIVEVTNDITIKKPNNKNRNAIDNLLTMKRDCSNKFNELIGEEKQKLEDDFETENPSNEDDCSVNEEVNNKGFSVSNIHDEGKADGSKSCMECGDLIPSEEWQTHQDYHVAINLELKINKDFEESYGDRLLKRPDRKPIKSKSNKKNDRSQSKLPF